MSLPHIHTYLYIQCIKIALMLLRIISDYLLIIFLLIAKRPAQKYLSKLVLYNKHVVDRDRSPEINQKHSEMGAALIFTGDFKTCKFLANTL